MLAAALWMLAAPAFAQSPDAEEAFSRARAAYALNNFQNAQIAAAEAAALGHAEAMTLLGFMHERGLGGFRDINKALTWYRAAAQENEPDALMALAAFAMDAQYGLTAADARGFLTRAMDAGRSEAALDLARLYLEGLGGAPDRDAALRLLEDTAAGANGEAAYRAGVILADNGEADARAAEFFEQAANLGHPQGATLYGHALYNGAGLAVDKPAAADWYQTAAQRGDAEGQVYHALILAGVAGDLDGAAYWLERSRLGESDSDALPNYTPLRDRLDGAVKRALSPEALAAAQRRARSDAGL